MQEMLDIYKELSIKYKELCFKVKNGNFFIIGIMTNSGPIVYKFDIKYFYDFNVCELDNLDYFNSLEEATAKLLNETDFSNVGYLVIKDSKLYKYFGNEQVVNIPNNVHTILTNAFMNNDAITVVSGNGITDVHHYAFRNNKKLTTLSFPNLKWLANILNAPNLKNYTISDHMMGFINEDNDYSDSTINVNGTPYVFDDSLESEFMERVEVYKENPSEEIQLVKLSDGVRKFRSVHDENRNQTIAALSHLEGLFNNLPDIIKDIFYKTNHTIYVVNELPDAGLYYVDENIILIHRTQVRYALYHEIGHMIDKYLEDISQTFDFKKIYYSEAHNLYKKNPMIDIIMTKECREHLISTSTEYFAESVKRYLENDSTFQSECPNTYMFIKDSIEYLEKKNQATLKLK